MINDKFFFRIIAGAFLFSLLFGCARQKEHGVRYDKCENLVAVTDHGKQIIFEKKVNSFDIIQRAEFHEFAVRQAVIDCKRNLLVLVYGARRNDQNSAGLILINMKTGHRQNYSIPEGVNRVITRYKNGLLYYTALSKREEINPEHGYVAVNEKFIDSSGKVWRGFEEVQYFDLDKRKVIQRYPTRMSSWVHLNGDSLFTTIIGAVVKVNLEKFFVEKLFDNETKDGINDNDYFGIPMGSMRAFDKYGNFYFIPNKISYDHRSNQESERLMLYEKGGIYKLLDGKFIKVSNQPFANVIEVIAVSDYLYLFTTGDQFVKFNTVTKQVDIHNMPIQKPSADYEINSVSRTDDSLVFSYVKGLETAGFVVMTDLALSKAGKPFAIENMSQIGISTNIHIQPNQTIESFFKERVKRQKTKDNSQW